VPDAQYMCLKEHDVLTIVVATPLGIVGMFRFPEI
jgi:hypothetical protein